MSKTLVSLLLFLPAIGFSQQKKPVHHTATPPAGSPPALRTTAHAPAASPKTPASRLKPNALAAGPAMSRVVTTWAGTGASGFVDSTAANATFNTPSGVARDASGTIFVADRSNHRIRKITASGAVTTFAGTGVPGFADGPGITARFNAPNGIAIDAAGNVYVSDANNNRIRKITPQGFVTTLAGNGNPGFGDGPSVFTEFYNPSGLAVDASGKVYVADALNMRIRVITPDGVTSTLAGDGLQGYKDSTGTAAEFFFPQGLALDAAGNLYVADWGNQRIRKITPAKVVTTLAGCGIQGFLDGPAATARFSLPSGVAVDAAGNVYVSDEGNSSIREITTAGAVITLAGDSSSLGYADGAGPHAHFSLPFGLLTDPAGNVFVADGGNNRIREITLAQVQTGLVTTLAGSGVPGYAEGAGNLAQFKQPTGVVTDAAGNVYVSDYQNSRIRKITPAGVVSTFAGNGVQGFADGAGSVAMFSGPANLTIDKTGNIYVADAGNNRIRKITPAGFVSTLAGSTLGYADGPGNTAKFSSPWGVAVDASGNVYATEYMGQHIRKITPAGQVSTFAGSGIRGTADGSATTAQFTYPTGIAIDRNGFVYVGEANHIRKINPIGDVTTLAGSISGYVDGTGAQARMGYIYGLAIDGASNLYAADMDNNRIRKISFYGVVTTIAGNGVGAFADGLPASSQFFNPYAITVDAGGTIFIADLNNNRVRKIN